MKIITFLFLSVITISIAFAQVVTVNSVNNNSSEWILARESAGVKLFYKFSDCSNSENGPVGKYIVIRLVNTSSAERLVEWDNVLWYNNQCINCEKPGDEFHKQVRISSGATIESSCSYSEFSVLNIFSGSLNKTSDEWKLTGFEFRNYTVKKIE